jgi:transcription antitermination factor NusG
MLRWYQKLMMVVVTGLCASMLYAQGGVPKDSAIAVRDREKLTGQHDVYKGKVGTGSLQSLVLDKNSRVIMQDAQRAIDETAVYESEELAVGDWVKVIDGPFNKVLGIVKKVEKDKITIYIKFFGGRTPLELGLSSVRRSHGPGYKELTEKYYRWGGGGEVC